MAGAIPAADRRPHHQQLQRRLGGSAHREAETYPAQLPAAGMPPLIVEVIPDLRVEPMPESLLWSNHRSPPRRIQAVMTWTTPEPQPLFGPKG